MWVLVLLIIVSAPQPLTGGARGVSVSSIPGFETKALCEAAAEQWQHLDDAASTFGTVARCFRLTNDSQVVLPHSEGYWDRSYCNKCTDDGFPIQSCTAVVCKPKWIPGDPPQPQPKPGGNDCWMWSDTIPGCPKYVQPHTPTKKP